MKFRAIFHDGKLEPLDMKLPLRENDTVVLEVVEEKQVQYIPLDQDDPELAAIRAEFADLPPSNLDEEIRKGRDRF